MGNINYKNFVCDNYYCQSVSFKPEWFSENSWKIDFNYFDDSLNDVTNIDTYIYTSTDTDIYNNSIELPIQHDIIDNSINKKPYIIDKGILKIKDVPRFQLLLSKKLLVNFKETKNISIPINFRYDIESKIDIFIMLSNYQITLENINNLDLQNNNSFFVNLTLLKKKIFISHSFTDKIIKRNINPSKISTFSIDLTNNFSLLLIEEKLFNNNIKKKYKGKYLKMFKTDENDNIYLTLFIKPSSDLFLKNEFIELNFE